MDMNDIASRSPTCISSLVLINVHIPRIVKTLVPRPVFVQSVAEITVMMYPRLFLGTAMSPILQSQRLYSDHSGWERSNKISV
jgi:hypothetical protein